LKKDSSSSKRTWLRDNPLFYFHLKPFLPYPGLLTRPPSVFPPWFGRLSFRASPQFDGVAFVLFLFCFVFFPIIKRKKEKRKEKKIKTSKSSFFANAIKDKQIMKYNIYPSYVWQSIFFISFLSNVTEMKKIMYHPFFFQQKHFLICFFCFFFLRDLFVLWVYGPPRQ